MSGLGPSWLGRGLIVNCGDPVPDSCVSLERVRIDEQTVRNPRAVADVLHRYWLARLPVTVELGVDADALKDASVEDREPHFLDPGFEFSLERLSFLVWANNYDLRSGQPIWWWARKARRLLGDRVVEVGVGVDTPVGSETPVGDVLVDGQPVWCDGGPRQSAAPEGVDAAVLHRDSIEAGVVRLDVLRGTPHGGQLADDQLAAVMHGYGPARIIAPAGSGKTRVLTQRLFHLIGESNWDPASILAVAYNKRAAQEMQARCEGLGARIKTLNALGLAICSGTAGFVSPSSGRAPNVIGEREQRTIIDSLIDVRPVANGDRLAAYLDGLRDIRLGLADPAKVEVAVDAEGLADMFPRYLAVLKDRNLIDFDGQLYEAIRVLLTNPVARRVARFQTRHMLVDEFQDLTAAHLLLVRLLSAPAYDVFGVGDDDQVIYGYSGASPRYLIDFEKYFPGASAYGLGANYRCPPMVVRSADTLLSYNHERIEKTIKAARDNHDESSIKVLLGDQSQCAADAFDVIEGFDGGDTAVLARVNSILLPLQVLLTERNVPCRAPLDESVLERTGMRAALAWLRIGLNPQQIRRSDLQETIRRPSRRIARNVVEMMTRSKHMSVDSMRRVGEALNGKDVDKVLSYVADIEVVARSARGSTSAEIMRTIRRKIGLDDSVDALDRSRREADRSTHVDDLVALEQVAVLHDDPATFEAWLRNCLRNRPSGDTGVELSTIHRVKGREWDNVVLYGCDNTLLPHRLASDISEERRLFHVAITRASERVALIGDKENPSAFIAEMQGSAPRKPQRTRESAGRAGSDIRESSQHSKREKDSKVAASADVIELDATGEQALEALRAWRKQTALDEAVPAYVILSNADARTIALNLPRDLKALGRCKGMGATRLERWGDEILSVLEDAVG